jgi:hypothetical protein
MSHDHGYAGQGAVLLDIGDDVGALVVAMPAAMAGAEIEIRPVGCMTRGPGHHPHVGVVARPASGTLVYSAVFGELVEGTYELYVRPDGPVQLVAAVTGGQVTGVGWPVPSGRAPVHDHPHPGVSVSA